MMDLKQHVLEAIKANPGQKAREISGQLSVDQILVTSVLSSSLEGKVQQDKSYQWFPEDGARAREDQGPSQLKILLARLCRYYVDCMNTWRKPMNCRV